MASSAGEALRRLMCWYACSLSQTMSERRVLVSSLICDSFGASGSNSSQCACDSKLLSYRKARVT